MSAIATKLIGTDWKTADQKEPHQSKGVTKYRSRFHHCPLMHAIKNHACICHKEPCHYKPCHKEAYHKEPCNKEPPATEKTAFFMCSNFLGHG